MPVRVQANCSDRRVFMMADAGIYVQNDFLWVGLEENALQTLRIIKDKDKRETPTNRRIKRRKKQPVKKPYVRKNRPYVRTSLECCLENCLYKNGGHAVMRMTRMDFSSKCYDEQNLMLRNLMEMNTPLAIFEDDNVQTRRTKCIYYLIDDNAKKKPVCRTAFLKTFGISVKRVRIVMSKVMPYTPGLKPDYRGKHHNRLKVSQNMRGRIYDFVIKNYKSEESHYCRERTTKRFLTPTVSKAGMWRKFVNDIQNQDCTDTKYTIRRKNTKHLISRSKFLEIVLNEFDFSFRKLRKDTCDFCDKYKASLSRTRNIRERNAVEQQHEKHLRRANSRYLRHDYDFLILAKAQSTSDWAIPPQWPTSAR